MQFLRVGASPTEAIMFKNIVIGCVSLVLSSCCYCVIQVPDLYPIPYEWELEEEWEVIEPEDCDATEVIPSGK